jgi:hypothetical protein
VVWDSPCHCWKAAFRINVNACDPTPTWKIELDLSSLAERARFGG